MKKENEVQEKNLKDLGDEAFEAVCANMRKPMAKDMGLVSHILSSFDQEIAIIANLLMVTPGELMELPMDRLLYVRGKFQALATYIPTYLR